MTDKVAGPEGPRLSEGLGLEPRIGRWRAYCCLMDLHPITTEKEAEAVKEFSREMWPALIFETLDDAVAALRGELEPAEEAAELARLGWPGPNVEATGP